eukprot:GEZU01038842.1.p1 GENE.GEZU01038842.1~~GEZU01038842.1.p1  ORF type:complete len:536 (+),score=172.90 GEZU01038842.1:116-1723(+)
MLPTATKVAMKGIASTVAKKNTAALVSAAVAPRFCNTNISTANAKTNARTITSIGRSFASPRIATSNNNESICFTNVSKFVQAAAPTTPTVPMQAMRLNFFHATKSAFDVVPFKLADIGEGITEVEILKWFVKEGDTINAFDKVCEVQSDKATVEITSRFAGTVKKLHYTTGQLAQVGKPLIDIETGESKAAAKPEAAPQPSTPATATPAHSTPAACGMRTTTEEARVDGKVLTTPAVRRIARENNINLALVKGTGKDGRVMKEDVLNFIKSGGAPVAAQPAEVAAQPRQQVQAPVYTPVAEDRIEPVRGLRRTMIKTMTAAVQVPHFGYCDEILMNNLVELRQQLKPIAEHKRGVKLSYMPFFIKAASMALKHYPILNSSLSADQQNIIYKGAHNIGIAMDTPQGLLVPNIKNVQNLSIFEIAAELNRLQQLGKEGKLSTADLSGGTFTLSNIGSIGGTYASPILFLPEVCIGAIGKMQKLPRFNENGEVRAANIVNVSWSADHRLIDGATMANFSNMWKDYLENPQLMILDMH